MSKSKKKTPRNFWRYHAVLHKGAAIVLNGETHQGEDYLVLEEVHYEKGKPVCSDGGQHIQVRLAEGPEAMIALLQMAIDDIRKYGVFETPWDNTNCNPNSRNLP